MHNAVPAISQVLNNVSAFSFLPNIQMKSGSRKIPRFGRRRFSVLEAETRYLEAGILGIKK
jgi:hypothetical protein